MSEFSRYAIYFSPRPGSELAGFGREWLGVDAEDGWQAPAPSPYVDSPRRYGFHATLKAPMRLAEGVSEETFFAAVETLANGLSAVEIGVLKPKAIGSFLALVTDPAHHDDVAALAWKSVTALDGFRASLSDTDRARRTGLTERQSAYFEAWGYPYVNEEFRFHMTLTSSLGEQDQRAAMEAVSAKVPTEPVVIDSISIFGDPGAPHLFRLVHRFDLKGAE